jgi:hypothetical protein
MCLRPLLSVRKAQYLHAKILTINKIYTGLIFLSGIRFFSRSIHRPDCEFFQGVLLCGWLLSFSLLCILHPLSGSGLFAALRPVVS